MKRGRREFLRNCSLVAAGSAGAGQSMALAAAQAAQQAGPNTIVVDPKPLFEISPLLYMQFMEPIGTTDPSVEASWDYNSDDWRKDLIEVTKDLAPGCVRWGGIYARYYKWREGVGPVDERPPMRNYVWGGWETNRIGTYEFVDFCRRVSSEPLMCVNFLSDGVKRYWEMNRTADAQEAAEWVSYCNDPDNKERKAHGIAEPCTMKLWQLGNETSYPRDAFSKEETIKHTIEFAKAMRERDPSIKLIGWGDKDRSQPPDAAPWAEDLIQQAGEHLDSVAFHMMGQVSRRPDTVLKGWEYQKNPAQAWGELDALADRLEQRVQEFVDIMNAQKTDLKLSVTEGHISAPPHNRCPILHEWLSGVYHARSMNCYQRHGNLIDIATAADFCGNRWSSNAVMVAGPTYMMPVATVMRLFKRHNGTHGTAVKSAPSNLDIAASRGGNKVYLHVANRDFQGSTEASLAVDGMTVVGGRVLEIAPEDPRQYVLDTQPDIFAPKEHSLGQGPVFKWRFPATSVSVVELDVETA